MTGEFWAAIAGAVIGAAVTGIISFYLQKHAWGAESAQRDKDALERKQTLARSFIVRLTVLHSHLNVLDRQMKAVFAHIATQPDPKPEPWQVARPLPPLPSLVHFPNDELTLLLTLKLDKLFNDAAMLDEIHNNTIATFEEYSKRKEELNALISPVGFTGNVAHFVLTPEQVRLARPKMVECNQLIEAMRERTERDTKESWVLLSAVSEVLNEKLQLKLQVQQIQPTKPVRL